MNNPSLHVLGTLWREGHKGSYCFDSQTDKHILLFQCNIPGTQNTSQLNNKTKQKPPNKKNPTIPQNFVMPSIWHQKDNLEECQPNRSNRPIAHPCTTAAGAHRPSIARLTEHPPLTSTARLLYHLTHIPTYWVACRDKNKTTSASFSCVGARSPPPQSFSVTSIELICTTTLQGNLEGTAGF